MDFLPAVIDSSYEKNFYIKIAGTKGTGFGLYDIAYTLVDLHHVLLTGNLLDSFFQTDVDSSEEIMQYLSTRGSILTRFEDITHAQKDLIRIKQVNGGSIELVLLGISAFSALFVPFVLRNLDRRSNRQRIYFDIRTDDKELQEFLDKYKDDHAKPAQRQYDWLLDTLAKKGYNVSKIQENLIAIDRIAETYNTRILKTIRIE